MKPSIEAKQQENADELNFFQKLEQFLRNNRKLFLVLLIAVLVAIVGLGVWTMVASNRLKTATRQLELIEGDLAKLQSLEDSAKKELEDTVLASSLKLKETYGTLYPALKATSIAASIYMGREEYTTAAELFAYIETKKPGSYLAPIALYNQAVSVEKGGDSASAIQLYEKIIEKYPEAQNLNRVLFNLGRLLEAGGNYNAARERYTAIIVKGDTDDWTKLAQSRIIFLDAKGLGK